jgi:hypothetical protein
MYSADKFLCVSLYARCSSACNFVRLGTLLQLSSNRFLFLYSLICAARLLPSACNFVHLGTLLQLPCSNRFIFLYYPIYAARQLPADISVRDVISWHSAYSIASSTEQKNGISRICYKQMVITPKP